MDSVYTIVYTSCRVSPMPKEPMKQHPIRVPEGLWLAAKRRADERGETVSEAIRKFLERYTR